jgi:hypothetical protein
VTGRSPGNALIALLLLAAAALDLTRCGIVLVTAAAALLIGVLSAPQAAASGFRPPYTFPDLATAGVGIVLAVIVLATPGRAGQSSPAARNAYLICRPGHDDQDQEDS